MEKSFSYKQFLELQEKERIQIVNLSKNKLTVDEKVKFEFKAKSGEYVTCALIVKLMNQRYCNEDVFKRLSDQVDNQEVLIEITYSDNDSKEITNIKKYVFSATEEYCYFEYYLNEDLLDSGYIYVDYKQHDYYKINGFLNIGCLGNVIGEAERNEIYCMFSEAVDVSIEERMQSKEIYITDQNKIKRLQEIAATIKVKPLDIHKEPNYDEWMKRMGLYDENGKMID